jgi:hypothetical protein
MPTNFESYELNTTVFVVKIWLEEFHGDNDRKWRGYITHVTSGKKQYIDGFLEIVSFIIPYLLKMRAKVNWLWRVAKFILPRKRRNKLQQSKQLSDENKHRSTS